MRMVLRSRSGEEPRPDPEAEKNHSRDVHAARCLNRCVVDRRRIRLGNNGRAGAKEKAAHLGAKVCVLTPEATEGPFYFDPMPGVGFIGMLVIGILAGWIAEKITSSDHSLLTNLLVGIAGSFIGGTLAGLLNLEFYGWLGNLLVATIGAILVLWVWRTVASYRY